MVTIPWKCSFLLYMPLFGDLLVDVCYDAELTWSSEVTGSSLLISCPVGWSSGIDLGRGRYRGQDGSCYIYERLCIWRHVGLIAFILRVNGIFGEGRVVVVVQRSCVAERVFRVWWSSLTGCCSLALLWLVLTFTTVRVHYVTLFSSRSRRVSTTVTVHLFMHTFMRGKKSKF